MNSKIKHFIELGQYGLDDPEPLIDLANKWRKRALSVSDKVVLNLDRSSIGKGESLDDTIKAITTMKAITKFDYISTFFLENSTRTHLSFQLAIQMLGYNVVDHTVPIKGLNPKALVIRHSGATKDIFKHSWGDFHIINAGSGTESHPTQALADMITIKEHFGDIKDLKVNIIGDAKNSRVFKSLALWLDYFGAKFGNTDHVDITYVLRHQNQPINDNCIKGMVMHAGPNTGQISKELAESDRSLIDKQVFNGVFARIAVLDYLI